MKFSSSKIFLISFLLLLKTSFLIHFYFTWSWTIPFIDSLDWLLSLMEGVPLYGGDAGRGASSSTEPRLPDLNLTPEEVELYERKLLEINNQKQELAELLEPVIRNEAGKYPGVKIEKVPSGREMVELLINRIGSEGARKQNKYSGAPTLFNNNFTMLKTWLTRACQNAEDGTQGSLPIRSEIRSIIEKYGLNDR